ncbi:DNA-binding response regulator [Galliscardovia ingluviei]|uniref:DNA-binding response regulator n=1 Tax=Galliscardovia ingluviei TaxID=1769422 RepID=A0A8J3F101_9BIFI|nr:response regulator transcription factor [Galliscardovia ingluviei]GGI12816.1 DNA-binding response regulator [Galliscardovia ingluviei]
MQDHPVITVGIADDQELVRAGFSLVIDSQPDLHVVGMAADGEQAVELVQQQQPDIMLMDVRMPNMDGIAATERISAISETTRVIMLTTFDLDEYVMAAISAGASGFLLKDTEPETLLASIRTVYQGNAIIAPTATKRLIEHMNQGTMNPDVARTALEQTQPASQHQQSPITQSTQSSMSSSTPYYTDPELELLTDREREVLVEIAHGLSNQEIADQLYIGLPTVKTHVAHILQKIHARDRVQAVVFAYENHLV